MINELLLLSKLNKETSFVKTEINIYQMLNDIINDLYVKIQETNALLNLMKK